MKRLILAISVLLVLGLAAAAIAYNRTAVAETAMSCCCCSGDSCPMKKDSASKDTASCCADGCCKDGTCAMKKDGVLRYQRNVGAQTVLGYVVYVLPIYEYMPIGDLK